MLTSDATIKGLIEELKRRREVNAELLRLYRATSQSFYEELDTINDMYEASIATMESFLTDK